VSVTVVVGINERLSSFLAAGRGNKGGAVHIGFAFFLHLDLRRLAAGQVPGFALPFEPMLFFVS
jgi:hypothetical protein